MADTAILPKPEKRKGFTARDVAAVFIKYEARCAKCREKVALGEYAIDHIQALDHLGKHELDNWQLLCRPCHAVKTASDVKASAKGRRLRGETGNGYKRPIPSRGFSPPLIATRESRDPDHAASGGKRMQSRGWNKGLRKRMNGKVERV